MNFNRKNGRIGKEAENGVQGAQERGERDGRTKGAKETVRGEWKDQKTTGWENGSQERDMSFVQSGRMRRIAEREAIATRTKDRE
jgi:hypothetical protein